jgi:hypothetical protein
LPNDGPFGAMTRKTPFDSKRKLRLYAEEDGPVRVKAG